MDPMLMTIGIDEDDVGIRIWKADWRSEKRVTWNFRTVES